MLKKYKDITKWHEELQTQAITYKRIKLPTGREYSFPYAERMPWGGSSYGTQIKNTTNNYCSNIKSKCLSINIIFI